jgi:hypothetical protein
MVASSDYMQDDVICGLHCRAGSSCLYQRSDVAERLSHLTCHASDLQNGVTYVAETVNHVLQCLRYKILQVQVMGLERYR